MSWEHFKQRLMVLRDLGCSIDFSRMDFDESFLRDMQEPVEGALADMSKLERGAIANPDENRMVGHYWLRAPNLAPSKAIQNLIETTRGNILNFSAAVHQGTIMGARGPFRRLLVAGVGGSALGPQFICHALGSATRDRLHPVFLDNTDPDGFEMVLDPLSPQLGETLTLVISKSGGTPETRNSMLAARDAYESAGLRFAQHSVAITCGDSVLHRIAKAESWLSVFPMWDWVGGRTSVTGPVGLLPAALQGIDIMGFLAGAADMDVATRHTQWIRNPALMLALMWYHATNGRGCKDMVILPYKDRLALFSKYLQQLVMESLGKERDSSDNVVHQGITVYGNKGSTDQHSYIQQLREGVANFFVTFIEVLRDGSRRPLQVEPDTTAGDYLLGFLLGTRSALYETGRESITITIDEVSPRSVGMLIALFERAVGLYASLVEVNAYHQPGVEAGKRAAAGFLELNRRIQRHLMEQPETFLSVEELALALNDGAETEVVYKLLEHLAANPHKKIRKKAARSSFETTYAFGP